MNTNLVNYIENSFLSPLLKKDSVTDISYNGKDIYYQDNICGRKKYQEKISERNAYDFIRQIANLSDSMFSFSRPILDISAGKYRINATHYAISRKEREKVINFSIRIGYEKLRIADGDGFISLRCLDLVLLYLKNKMSVIISGTTSSGKTEFQKYLISKFPSNTRIILIDNIDELDMDYISCELDTQTWLLNENAEINFDLLVKNALRVNPDWLVISESRGKEMLSLLNSSMTGHPTISTIHSKNIECDYSRMTRMCMLGNNNLKYDETLIDVYDHFKLLIHVRKKVIDDGKIIRFVDSIGTNVNNNFYLLFKYPNNYYDLPSQIISDLTISEFEFNEIKKRYEHD